MRRRRSISWSPAHLTQPYPNGVSCKVGDFCPLATRMTRPQPTYGPWAHPLPDFAANIRNDSHWAGGEIGFALSAKPISRPPARIGPDVGREVGNGSAQVYVRAGSSCASPGGRSPRPRRTLHSGRAASGRPGPAVDRRRRRWRVVALYQPSSFLQPPPCKTIVPVRPHWGEKVPGVMCASRPSSRRASPPADAVDMWYLNNPASVRASAGKTSGGTRDAGLARGRRHRHRLTARLHDRGARAATNRNETTRRGNS